MKERRNDKVELTLPDFIELTLPDFIEQPVRIIHSLDRCSLDKALDFVMLVKSSAMSNLDIQ